MPTVVNKTIGTGGDYSTLQAWEDDFSTLYSNNLVTADVQPVGKCLNEEFTSAGNVLTISGETVDATHFIKLQCNTGASFRDNAGVRSNALYYNASNGAGIRTTGNYSACISIGVDNVVLFGLQIQSKNGGNSTPIYMSAGNGLTIDSCIVHAPLATAQAFPSTGFQVNLYNSLFIGGTNATGTVSAGRNGGAASNIIGCTVITTGSGSGPNIYLYNYATHTVKDTCGFGGNKFVENGTTSSANSSYNATDQASGFGSSNQTSLTFASQFQNSTNDFRAIGTGSLDLNGTPDSTNIPNDISGQARDASTPTIGCWEVVAVASGTLQPFFECTDAYFMNV